MAAELDLVGVGTALATPFAADGVDFEAIDRFVAFQLEGGVDFLVPCGTTGESSTLTDAERIAVIERVVAAAGGRVPVIAGTGTNDTSHSVAMTREARRVGADGCLAVSPYYNRPTQEGLYRHFRAMIDEGGLPAVLYHIPSRGAEPIEIETVGRVAAAGGVLGVKETGGVDRVVKLTDEGVDVLSGDDALTYPMMALGAVGVISVASNVAPDRVRRLVRLIAEGEMASALGTHESLAELFAALFCEPNPIPVKAALHDGGLFSSGAVRLPLIEASTETRQALLTALSKHGLVE